MRISDSGRQRPGTFHPTIIGCLLAGMALAQEPSGQWPQWRGPDASGTSATAKPPIHWHNTAKSADNQPDSNAIRWKTELPGLGNSTPVVWADKVFVTTAVDVGDQTSPDEQKKQLESLPDWQRKMSRLPKCRQQFAVLAIRREDGKIAWRANVLDAMPIEGTHADGSWASGSPIVDGERIYAYFGSYGLYCLDLAGNVLWSKSLGQLRIKNRFGEGASPFLTDDRLIVCCDHEGDSFIVAIDKTDGKELWRTPRKEITSWATPLVIESAGLRQVVVAATGAVRGYGCSDGALLWEVAGLTTNVIPSPLFGSDLVYVMSGFRGNAAIAIRPEPGNAAVVWTMNRNTPYVPSPLLCDGKIYFLKGNEAFLTCVDASTGKIIYEAKKIEGLDGGVYASPVAADGRLYVLGRKGVTAVMALGPEFKVLARNSISDEFSASPALAGGDMFLRGAKALYCISENQEQPQARPGPSIPNK